MKKITILTDPCEYNYPFHGDVGILFECAPDTDFKHEAIIPITKIIQDPEETRKQACQLVNKIVAGEPLFRGIPQFTIFREAIAIELQKILRAIQLHHFMISNGYQICKFISYSAWCADLQNVVNYNKSHLKIEAPENSQASKLNKLLMRILANKSSLTALHSDFNQFLCQIDPFHRRHMLFTKNKNMTDVKNKSWFYTTAITYTNVGLLYESVYSEPFYYLVEDATTGGLPLKNKQRPFVNLYDFAKPEFIPKLAEIQQAHATINQHVSAIPLTDVEFIARDMLMNRPWAARFFSQFLPQGLFFSAIFENWLEKTMPTKLTVGNGGFEDYALYKARDKKIPTCMLQHGVVSDYFPYFDYPVDQYVMRGQFFYERLSPLAQQRAVIFNPTKNSQPQNEVLQKKNDYICNCTLASRYSLYSK